MTTKPLAALGIAGLCLAGIPSFAAADVRFAVTLPTTVQGPVTGRVIVVTSRRATPEPRLAFGLGGPPAFGIDVEGLKPGETAVVDAKSDGYPFDLSALPAGEYEVQALLVRYTQAKRSDGHTIWVPFSETRAQAPRFPGNLFRSNSESSWIPPARHRSHFP